jgi:NAD(P)-dependent dehydrogenase (short-subunit alcohol dehydrogenase family)
MTGTVIITGANSSLAIPAVGYLLKNYPEYTVVLTVRNASDKDANTASLRAIASQHPQAKIVIYELDLAVLSAVENFASTISKNISDDTYPPIVAVICNAFHWNLAIGDPELTSNGYEKTFQVNHIAHASLVLRLLDQFDPAGSRIVSLSSDAHWPGKAVWEKIPPEIPSDIESLVKPPVEADYTGRPFQRYANSKLAIVMWTHALNRRLLQVSSP